MSMQMPTIWGYLDRVDDMSRSPVYLQVKMTVRGGTVIRMRPVITGRTLIARGTERIDPSALRPGEMIELTYRNKAGKLEAETIYVRPDVDGTSSG